MSPRMALRRRILAAVILLSATIAAAADGYHSAHPALDQLGILRALGRSHQAIRFAGFAQQYRKNYRSTDEIKRRYEIFVENLRLIEATNRRGLTYKLGVNEFADWTWEEFRATRLGAAQNCSATARGNHVFAKAGLPDTKDWRKDGIVSPVKDQESCGSCWTFSATGALEAAYKQLTGKAISLSEQQLVDCANAFNNNGCEGGLPSQAFEYIKYNGGLETEGAYPYQAVNGACSFDSNKVGVKVVDSVNITMGAEDELKEAVGLIRPVSVAFQVVSDFSLYKSGVYSSSTCGSSPMDVNHAVLAVGYGVENGIPFWLIKNSWGEDWGDHGYFKMELGKNMCGVATCASYPIVGV
ncbi:Cysteine proteinase 2 [Apostasia shenzhenica]|uniref:Cysteine proteinase 2 n=1 Tax=Apostasia shenzhenica TaxID=1088818 RepID=A0A2I0A212_9ASPA|nr:Cysteine proteinase 2 [Apostasia shenzhenica]